MKGFNEHLEITEIDKKNLEDFMRDSKFSGIVSITADGSNHLLKTPPIDHQETPFSIHSVGKVFTGMLLMVMIQKGIITEEMLDEPIQLEKHVVEKLREKGISQEQLNKITLRQAMQHKSGLGDFLGNYQNVIQKALDEGKAPPEIKKPEDLLEYADGTIKTLKEGEELYSNLGSLLFGLSIQYHYNKKIKDQSMYTPYTQILRKHIVEPADLKSFSEIRPDNAHYNEKDANTYLYGAPAGGYWLTAKDLDKFGQWICKQYKEEDPKAETSLHNLLEKHGREFYGDGMVGHLGAVPTGSANLAVYLDHGVSVAVMSDQFMLEGDFAAQKIDRIILQNLLTI